MTRLIDKRDLEILADIYMKEGQAELADHNTEAAMGKMNKALKLLKRAKSTELYVKNLNIVGVTYTSLGDEQKAFECYLEAMAHAEVIRSSYLKALCDINVGSCYQKLERNTEAARYFKDAEMELSKPEVDKEHCISIIEEMVKMA